MGQKYGRKDALPKKVKAGARGTKGSKMKRRVMTRPLPPATGAKTAGKGAIGAAVTAVGWDARAKLDTVISWLLPGMITARGP